MQKIDIQRKQCFSLSRIPLLFIFSPSPSPPLSLSSSLFLSCFDADVRLTGANRNEAHRTV